MIKISRRHFRIKASRTFLLLLGTSLAVELYVAEADLATSYWDPTQTGGSATGGAGTWDGSSLSWSSAATGGTDAAWFNGNNAVFAGTGGAVTLGGPITVNTITFNSLDYTISTAAAAPLTLTGGIVISSTTTGSTQDNIDGAGGLFLSGDQTVNTGAFAINIKTVLSGSDVLTKTGTGTLGLSGVNTFTGKFVVNQGFLGFNSDAALGAVPTLFQADNITLNGGTLVMGVDFHGSSSHTNVGTASLNANRGIYLGPNGGSIRVGFGTAATLTVNGVISGPGNLTKTDSGTLILTANNTYLGTTTIQGTLQIGNGGTTGSVGLGKIIFAAGTTNYLTYDRSDPVTVTQDIDTGPTSNKANLSALLAGQQVTFTGAISGSGEFWKQGAGTIVIAANSNSNRATSTVIREGRLQVSDLGRNTNSALGSGNIYIGHSSLATAVAGLSYTGASASTDAIQNVQSINGFIEVADPNTTLTITNRIVSNTRAGGADDSVLNKIGPGTLNLGGSVDNNLRMKVTEGTLELAKDNSAAHSLANSGGALTYALVQNGGTVRITGAGGDQIYDASTVKINGGTFDFNGHNEGFDILLSDSADGVITNNLSSSFSVFTLGTNNGTSVYNGKIQDGAGSLGLVKTGTGALTLTNNNNLTGSTEMKGGRLIVSGSLTGSTTFVEGGVLGGTGTVGDVTVIAGTISPGATAKGVGLGTLHTGSLDLSGAVYEAVINTSALAASLAEIQGDLTIGFSGALLTLTDLGTDTGEPVGTKFTLMSYTGSWDEGIFSFGTAGFIDNNQQFTFGSNTFQLTYDAVGLNPGEHDVVLTVISSVPEPASGGLLLGGVALLAGRRRRKSGGLKTGSIIHT